MPAGAPGAVDQPSWPGRVGYGEADGGSPTPTQSRLALPTYQACLMGPGQLWLHWVWWGWSRIGWVVL